MIIFIIPLRSKESSRDWNLITRLLKNSLNSIYNQTSRKFKIILVCNEIPLNIDKHENLEIIVDSFPIPKTSEKRYLDQKLKIKRGMIEARKYGNNYLMRMDADDFINRNIVSYVENQKLCSGWYIPKGYVFLENKPWIYKRNNFHFSCGTSHIIYVTKEQMPKDMETPSNEYLEVFWQHLSLKKYFEDLKTPLKPLPFRGASYTIGYGDSVLDLSSRNFTSFRKLIWKAINIRPLTSNIKNLFSFPQSTSKV